MRRIGWTCIAAMLVLVACDAGERATVPTSPPPTAPAVGAMATMPGATAAMAAMPTANAGGVGAGVGAVLTGSARPTIVPGASALRATGGQVLDPAPTAANQQPAAGNRCVAIDVTLTNTGTRAESYSAGFGALQTRDGQWFMATFSCSTAQPQFAGGMLQPGANVRGYALFEVPQGAMLAVYTLTDDAGHLAGEFRF